MPMMCPPPLASAPAEVIATIKITGTAPNYSMTASPIPDGISASYITPDGHLCFHSFNKPVVVTFIINTRGMVFVDTDAGTPILFSDDPGGVKYPVARGHHQFQWGVNVLDHHTIISFQYNNDNSCAATSIYGFAVADRNGNNLGVIDPVVDNGGNQGLSNPPPDGRHHHCPPAH